MPVLHSIIHKIDKKPDGSPGAPYYSDSLARLNPPTSAVYEYSVIAESKTTVKNCRPTSAETGHYNYATNFNLRNTKPRLDLLVQEPAEFPQTWHLYFPSGSVSAPTLEYLRTPHSLLQVKLLPL